MGETRNWLVRSNSFRQDYRIEGDTLGAAILAGLPRIRADALPKDGKWRAVGVQAEWRPDILGGRGGVELVIHATQAGGVVPTDYPVWIVAAPSDLPVSMSLSDAMIA